MTAATVREQQRVQHIEVRNVSWETYERLLEEREGHSPRLAFDRGVLELVSPRLWRHEKRIRDIESLVAILALETGLAVETAGETTYRRPDLEKGFEPDASFYIQNEARIRGTEQIDLRRDPPPDLVVEVDVTNTSLPKLPLYAAIGIPELWRHDGARLDILTLEGDRYVSAAESQAFPGVSARALTDLLHERGDTPRTPWLRRVRAWARDLAGA